MCVPTFGDFDGLSKLPFEAVPATRGLPPPVMAEFNALGHPTLYPANATLMTEGEIPRASISPARRAKLSIRARDGKTII